jgi:hypothetical protein
VLDAFERLRLRAFCQRRVFRSSFVFDRCFFSQIATLIEALAREEQHDTTEALERQKLALEKAEQESRLVKGGKDPFFPFPFSLRF